MARPVKDCHAQVSFMKNGFNSIPGHIAGSSTNIALVTIVTHNTSIHVENHDFGTFHPRGERTCFKNDCHYLGNLACQGYLWISFFLSLYLQISSVPPDTVRYSTEYKTSSSC
jgi:hypothetical protein